MTNGDMTIKGQDRQAVRHRQLVDSVIGQGSMSIEDLSSLLKVSVMTVHRDLDLLDSQGIIRKSRGMATALPSSAVESTDAFRRSQQATEKAELAAVALESIQPGQTVLLDDSTTLLPLLEILHRRAPLTIVSNSLSVVDALVEVQDISVVAVGGEHHRWCNAFMGQMTTDSLHNLRVDVLIMSTSAVVDGSCYHQRQDTVSTKRAMLSCASERILLVDHTKFEKRALYRLCGLTDFTRIIVDSRTPQSRIDEIANLGVEIIVAGTLS